MRTVLTAFLSLASFAAYADFEVGYCAHVTYTLLDSGGEYGLHHGIFALGQSAGLRHVRADFNWTWMTNATGYAWERYDKVMASARAEGVTVLPILLAEAKNGTPPWQCSDRWKGFVRDVLQHYPGQIPAVEVWNEQNQTVDGSPRVSESDYLSLLKATYDEVKAVDPSIKVVLGGFEGRCGGYFKNICEKGKDWFDVVAFHPYNNTHAPGYEPSWLSDDKPGANKLLDEFRSAMSSKGIGNRPIWITEIGWPTWDGGVSESQQATYLKDFLEYARNHGVERVYIYEFRSSEHYPENDKKEGFFGLTRKNLTLKPAFSEVAKYLVGNDWTNPYDGCVFLASPDDAGTPSFGLAGHWSDQLAPSAGKDYLVDIGADFPMRAGQPNDAGVHVFDGRSLTVGLRSGRQGGVLHSGASSTVKVDDLRLVAGAWQSASGGGYAERQTLAATATVYSTKSAPFTFKPTSGMSRFYRLSGKLIGAAGTAIRFASGDDGSAFDVICDFDGRDFHGSCIVDGANVTVRFAQSAFAHDGGLLTDGIVLTNGAKIAQYTASDLLTGSNRGIMAYEGARISVMSGATMTLGVPVSGTLKKVDAGTLVLENAGGDGLIVREGGAVETDAASAVHLEHYVIGADDFEAYRPATCLSGMAGWSGDDGVVLANTPAKSEMGGYPQESSSHLRTLSAGMACRTYASGYPMENRTVDFLYEVNLASDDWIADLEPAANTKFAIVADSEGYLRLNVSREKGLAAWKRLTGLGPHRDGEWVRITVNIDCLSVPGSVFVQVRENGSCCLPTGGFRSPTVRTSPGSWLQLPASAFAVAQETPKVRLEGEGGVDDLVLTGYKLAHGSEAAFGPVDAVGGVPVSWFDSYGIPRDPNGDPDGDGFANRDEWKRGTDPIDCRSHPPRPSIIILR